MRQSHLNALENDLEKKKDFMDERENILRKEKENFKDEQS